MEDLINKSKQCLSIISTSTLKDDEIQMWINAGIKDLKRQGIKASADSNDELIKAAIIMFVKSNFGNVDLKEKQLAKETYNLLCCNLSLSDEYKEDDSNA